MQRPIRFLCGSAILMAALGCVAIAGDENKTPFPTRLIAHAAGGIEGRTYTNSRQALDANYARGHRCFEMDFDWTSDGHLVLIHGWDASFMKWFEGAGKYDRKLGQRPSLDEFKAMKMKHGMTHMTLEDLYSWMSAHEDTCIVTDVKSGNNIKALKLIANSAGGVLKQFIPQLYRVSEFGPAGQLGFERFIFTLYQTKIPKRELLDFLATNKVFAVTMTMGRATTDSLAQDLKKRNIFTYVHTINSTGLWKTLKQHGVSGLYTDFLSPADVADHD